MAAAENADLYFKTYLKRRCLLSYLDVILV